MMREPDFSPHAAFTAAIGTLIGPMLAQYVAAYVLILLGWCAGVLWGVYKREPEARMPVWAYVVATLLASVGITATAAGYMAALMPDVATSALLFPVAFAIPAFPERWVDIGDWLMRRWQALRGVRE